MKKLSWLLPLSGLVGFIYSFPLLAATEAHFCKRCTTTAIAQQEARYYEPELICESSQPDAPMTPENQICYSNPKSVVLASPTNRQLHSFLLERNPNAPYQLSITPISLTSQEQHEYLMGIDFYNELAKGIQYTNQQLNQTVYTAPSQPLASSFTNNSANSTCPQNTALSTLVDPTKMEMLKNKITQAIASGTGGKVEDYFQRGVQLNSFGITGPSGAGISFGWDSASKLPNAVVLFNNTEQHDAYGQKDALIFAMELGQVLQNGDVYIKYTLHDASKIAGISLSGWRGAHGAITHTNQCIIEQLAKLQDAGGDFRRPDGSSSPFGGPGWTAPGSGDAGGVQTCTIHFYQSGQLLYVFRVPMNGC
jgi:hypothetical protein